jgi:hypothetical protein
MTSALVERLGQSTPTERGKSSLDGPGRLTRACSRQTRGCSELRSGAAPRSSAADRKIVRARAGRLQLMRQSLADGRANMVNGKTPIFLTILAAGLFVAALFTLQPYSADWPGRAYIKPAQRYIRVALRQDSVRLARLSASDIPVVWALGAARTHPASLALWAGHTRAWTGVRSGDTTEVFLYPPGEVCSEAPIVFRFVGSGSDARVLSASSPCLDPS